MLKKLSLSKIFLNQIEFLTMFEDEQTIQNGADVVLFIMGTWVGKMELSCLVCVHKKKILWQTNTQTDQSYFGSCLIDIRLYYIFFYGWTMWTSSQTKPRLFYFIWHFSHRISSQWRYFGREPPRGEQNHWRSKHQIVERHTYHPKQNKHKQKTAINRGELV